MRRSNQLSYEATEFFRLLYTIANVAFISARIIALLDCNNQSVKRGGKLKRVTSYRSENAYFRTKTKFFIKVHARVGMNKNTKDSPIGKFAHLLSGLLSSFEFFRGDNFHFRFKMVFSRFFKYAGIL